MSNSRDGSFLFEKAAKPSNKGGHIEWPPLFVIRGNRYLIVIDCEKYPKDLSNSGDGSCVPSVASVTLRDAERFSV